MFRAARETDYNALLKEITSLGQRTLKAKRSESPHVRRAVRACRNRLTEIVAIDFFAAPARRDVEAALATCEGKRQALRTPVPDIHRKLWIDASTADEAGLHVRTPGSIAWLRPG
jgi:hypothetical protein